MGKADIISHISKGKYLIKLKYGTGQLQSKVIAITQRIVDLETQLFNTDSTKPEYGVLRLQINALQRQLDYLTGIEDEKQLEAWCADLTEDLSGQVGTAEIPGEIGIVQVLPGYDGRSNYDESRDGQLVKTEAQNPYQAYVNLARLPGWQKWKPTYRHGEITSIDEDICNVLLEDVKSSQQGLNINQTPTLTDVPIEYMNCNGAAFEVGDKVLVRFENFDWSKPKVIGFKEEPKPCGEGQFIVITHGDKCIVFQYNLEEKTLFEPEIFYPIENEDDPLVQVTFPVKVEDLQFWLDTLSKVPSPYMIDKSTTYVDYAGFGPPDDGCPLVPYASINRYMPGVTLIDSCVEGSFKADCLYYECFGTAPKQIKAYQSKWYNPEGNIVGNTYLEGGKTLIQYQQNRSIYGADNFAHKAFKDHQYGLDVWACEMMENYMNLGPKKVGILTSKYYHYVQNIETARHPDYIPLWIEDLEESGHINDQYIYKEYAKKFPFKIPDLDYKSEQRSYSGPDGTIYYYEDYPIVSLRTEGKYNKDVAILVVCYKATVTRHDVPDTSKMSETIDTIRELKPKTAALGCFEWLPSPYSKNVNPWDMPEKTIINTKMQELLDSVDDPNVEFTVDFMEV